MVNGWKTKKLGEVAEVCMCKRIFAHQTSKIGNIPFYKIGTFGKEADAYISSQLYEEYKSKYSYPEKGDVLISAAGTLGRTVVFDGRPAYFQDSNIVWLKIDKSQLSNDYLAQYYKVIKWASSEGSTISRLYNGIICDTEILLPPLEEQVAIAKALSDVDSLISSLQKLIEKKKAIKQGAMQELLTGKKRLPGFSEEWAYRRVGEICSITKGQIITEKTAIHGNVPVIAGGKTPAFYHNVANRESDVITISASGANAGYIAYHDYPIFASDCSTIESSDQYDVKFIYYALLYHQQELIGMQTGGAQPHIHPKEIGVLLVPRINQEEQRAIANVLSDMDSEIERLEKKLAKYQQIKQGMMQELLTGRIRLV